MDNFDKHVSGKVQEYLNKHVHFSREESQQILSKITNKSSTKKFHGVYYIALASTIVLFCILSIPLFDTLNFNSNPKIDYATVTENEIEDKNSMNGEGIYRSQKILTSEAQNKLQLSIIDNPEKYKLKKASLNYRNDYDSSEEVTSLALSFQSEQNNFYTQIFKGEVRLEDHHKIIEKVGEWSLIPASETHSNMEENKYAIAVSEIINNHEIYTIIVQTYDIHDDFYANPYSKTEILNFTDSFKPELAVKNLLELIPED